MTTGSSPVAGHWVKRGGRLGGRRESGRWGRPLSGPFGQRHVILRWSGCGDHIWRRVGTRARLIEGTVGTALRLLVRSATPSVWDFVAAGGVGGKEGFEPQRHRGHRVVTESAFIPFCDLLCASVPLWCNAFYCVRRPLWGVAIIDGARLWPVGHNPALFINAMRLPGVRVGRWPVPRRRCRMDRPVPRR
jgi:hypothetical protein